MPVASRRRVSQFLSATWFIALLAACAPSAEDPEGAFEPAEAPIPPAQETPPPPPQPPPAPVPPPTVPPLAPAPQPQPPPPITDVIVDMCEGRDGLSLANDEPWGSISQARAAAAIQCDALEIMRHVATLGLPNDEISAIRIRVRDLTGLALDQLRAAPIESSRLPLSAWHQKMYETAAEAERSAASARLVAWVANPWHALGALESPRADAAEKLATSLMPGERRALAFNVRNTFAQPQRLTIRIAVPGVRPDLLQIFRVNWTGYAQGSWAAAELEFLGDAGAPREATILPGITSQFWVQVRPSRMESPGRLSGTVSLIAGDVSAAQIPIELTMFASRFPQQPSLHFGGWDYADPLAWYAVTDANRTQFVEYLQEQYVDTPWAHRVVMHWNNLGRDGNPTGPLDTSAMQRWIAEWPKARRFRVFVNVGDNIAEIPITDASFARAVGTWAQAWAAEIRLLGKSPEQFDLLLVDEPQSAQQARTTELWAQAIRRSGAGFTIWCDPLWPDPALTPQTLIDSVDTITINFQFAERATQYWAWARRLTTMGKKVEIYAYDGPARRLDPHAYYRLAAWRAHFIDAAGISFWSLADTGRSASDHEFAAHHFNYSPFFVSGQTIRPGKHMEAIVEGIQDAEYLQMLAAAADSHPDAAARARAAELRERAREFVARAPASSTPWLAHAADDEIDALRMEIGGLLDSLPP